ncbi:tetratricopeptide repeat protein [Paraflavitalea pollutisoli]|uniref:tetratricopeptide repeat protein n=1 Tax=Paraflavitalea pollutisoli TaxID=3034143 RepID=UPI0023ECB2A9|nr:hypothetical protein [Paraflavitalea sp. H1-2-19X]
MANQVKKQTPVWEDIAGQMDRIRGSKEFSSKELLCRFLDYVVTETMAGRVNEIKEYTIGTRALGRPGDFNPQFDACVRIHAGRLRQALGAYYADTGKADPIRIMIPKGTYVPIFSVAHEEPATPGLTPPSPASSPNNRLTMAVMPFQNRGPESGRNYFADVVSEQLSTEIAHFRNISVISYYSMRLIAQQLTDLNQLYNVYGVHYVLTGSVQLVEEHIRIHVQLIYTPTSEQIWAGNYEQPLSALPLQNVSDDVTQHIASVIAGYYGAIIQHISMVTVHEQADVLGTHNAAFWHYKYHKAYTVPILLQAQAAVEATLQATPHNALAWAVLGEIHLDSYLLEMQPASIIDYGIECANKSIHLDRYCLHGYQSLAWAYMLQKNRQACIRVIDDCLALNYNASNNIGWLGMTLIFIGEFERGRSLLEKAMDINPFYPWCYCFTMTVYYYAQANYEMARYWGEKINMPSLKFDLVVRTATLGKLGLLQEGMALGRELTANWPAVDREIKPFLQKFILADQVTEDLLEGLAAAGIPARPL